MEFSNEDVIQLIQEYEKHRLLWDAKDKWHFNKLMKNDAWNNISAVLNIDNEEAKKKIASLLGSFRREKAKGKKTMGTGKGTREVYKSNWFAFKSFSFLMDKDEPRDTLDSEDATVEMVELIEVQNQGAGCSMETVIEETECAGEISQSFLKPTTPTRKRTKKLPKESGVEDPRIQKAFEYLQQPIQQEDSTTMYSKYLADKLNQFDPRTKSIIIHKINQIIFDAEMNLYSEPFVTNNMYSRPMTSFGAILYTYR